MKYASPLKCSACGHFQLFMCVNVLRCIVYYLFAGAKIEMLFT